MKEVDGVSWLARWARRKAAARRPTKAVVGASPATASHNHSTDQTASPSARADTPTAAPALSPSAEVRVEDLPPIDSLTYDSDFSPYLRPGVPEALREQALRKLWRSNPVLANLDGLNDYDEDYSRVGMIEETVETLFRVGRGMANSDAASETPPPESPATSKPSAAASLADDVSAQTDATSSGTDTASAGGAPLAKTN